MNSSVKTFNRVSVKVQTLAAVTAIIAAVALPQILHTIGGISLGEMLLPMHMPIMLVGFLAGPYAGAISGILAPLVSFVLTGMPLPTILPFMVIELCVYGLCSGILKNAKMPSVFKVLLSQFSGRVVRAIAILTSIFALGNESVKVSVIWTSVIVGVWGIAVQLILIPAILKGVEKVKR